MGKETVLYTVKEDKNLVITQSDEIVRSVIFIPQSDVDDEIKKNEIVSVIVISQSKEAEKDESLITQSKEAEKDEKLVTQSDANGENLITQQPRGNDYPTDTILVPSKNLQASRKALVDKEEEIKNENKELEKMEEEIKNKKRELEKIEEEVKKERENLKKIEEEVKKERENLKKVEEEIAELTKTIEDLDKKKEILKKDILKKEEELKIKEFGKIKADLSKLLQSKLKQTKQDKQLIQNNLMFQRIFSKSEENVIYSCMASHKRVDNELRNGYFMITRNFFSFVETNECDVRSFIFNYKYLKSVNLNNQTLELMVTGPLTHKFTKLKDGQDGEKARWNICVVAFLSTGDLSFLSSLDLRPESEQSFWTKISSFLGI